MYFDLRLFAMTQGVRLRIFLAALIGLAGLPVSLARLALSGIIIAAVIRGQPIGSFAGTILTIALLIAARAVIQVWRDQVANRTAAEMKVRLRANLFGHVLTLGPGPIDQRRTGGVLLTLVESVEMLETFFGQYLPQLVVAALTPLIVFIFMAFLDLPTALIFLLFAVFTLVVPALFHRWNRASSLARRDAYSALGNDLVDGIQGLPTLKVFNRNRTHGALLAHRARHLYRSTMLVLAANIATSGVTVFGISAGAALALGWGAVRVEAGSLDLQTLIIVLLLGVEVFRPLRELTQLYHRGMVAMSATEGIYALLDAQPDVHDPGDGATGPVGALAARAASANSRAGSATAHVAPAIDRPTDTAPAGAPDRLPGAADNGRAAAAPSLAPEVTFEDVAFAYPNRRAEALRGISFTLRRGETLAVVGPSGAGKSTLVWLLLRFFDPTRGRITLGGRDLRELSLAELRRHVAVVAQDTYLFHGTVAENLRIGKGDATQDELEGAARAANAHEFIAGLPKGYDTIVGERGARLSGGQRQRIAIARALLKDAPILVLDEALSSVDAENEAVIQQALDRLQVGRTTLVIAHRLSSVIGADRILVLEDGLVAETGRHAELVAAGGTYARLMAAQREEPLPGGDFIDDGEAAPHGSDLGDDFGGQDRRPAPAIALHTQGDHDHDHPEGNLDHPEGDHDHNHANGDHGYAHAGHAHAGHNHADHVHADRSHAAPSVAALAVPQRLPFLGLWGRLLGLVRPWWLLQVVVFILGVLHAAAVVGLGVVGSLLVRQVAIDGDLAPWLWALGLLVPVAALLTWAESWLAHDLAYRLLAEMRIDLYEKLDPLAPGYLLRRRTGDLVSAVTGDVETVEYFFAHTIAPAFVAILVPGGVLVALAWMSPWLALALIPFLVLVALSPVAARRSTERVAAEARETLGGVSAHMVDSVQGLRTIVSFGGGDARLAEIERNGRLLSEYQLRFAHHQTVQAALIEAFTGYGGLAVLVVGAWLANQGALAPTYLPLATLLALASFGPVGEIAKIGKQLAETLAASRRVFIVHDEPVTVLDGPGVAPARAHNSGTGAHGSLAVAGAPANGRSGSLAVDVMPSNGAQGHLGEAVGDADARSNAGANVDVDAEAQAGANGAPSVVFQSVTFSYGPGEPHALRDVSFAIAPGQTVAIVGRSGAGKTTAAHLLLRFWDPQAGSISIDGHDLREYRLDDLRDQIGLVAQDTYLFNASLASNLGLGREGASDEDVAAAARAANAEGFIGGLPEGYETVVGERGVSLSGGQRQRIAIARALLKDAPILVLDEATSHLDAENERQVRGALDRLTRGRTTLVIAHRLSTIRHADCIVVLDGGRVAEQGTHDELLARGGIYATLVATQIASQSGQPRAESPA